MIGLAHQHHVTGNAFNRTNGRSNCDRNSILTIGLQDNSAARDAHAERPHQPCWPVYDVSVNDTVLSPSMPYVTSCMKP